MTSNTSSKSVTKRDGSLSVAIREDGLPDLTPAAVRNASWAPHEAKAMATRVGEVSSLHRKRGDAILYVAALTLYGAIQSGHVGPKGVPQKDYATAMGQDPTVTSRLVTIGRGVVDWRVKHGTKAYGALVAVAYGQGGKDRKDQRDAIRAAMDGDPSSKDDREKFNRAMAAWLAGPPKTLDSGDSTESRGPNREGGGDGPKGVEDNVHALVRDLPGCLTAIRALGNVIATLSQEDQDTALEAMGDVATAILSARDSGEATSEPQTVKGEATVKS